MKFSLLKTTAAALILCVAPFAAHAQAYPSKPVRVVVPFGPGTGVDLMARAVADHLSKTMGQSFVVDNKPGAAGAIAGAIVASAAPDGYTLLVNASSQTTLPALAKNLPYDGKEAFVGVAAISESPMVLLASKAKGFQNVQTLVAASKAAPGSLSYGSAGVGSTTHFAVEKFRMAAGLQGVHVPFKSSTDALAELMAGRIDIVYTALPSAQASVKDGRAVAIAMGQARSAKLPGVPTVAEAGFPSAAATVWFGLFAPAKTPKDIVTRLHAEITKAQSDPEFKDRLDKAGGEPYAMSIDQFAAFLKKDFADNEALVKSTGLKVE